jgi:hypothetical protein
MTRKELYKQILNELMEQLENYREIHFTRQLKGKNFSYKFSIKKEFEDEFYIKFDKDNSYELVSKKYIEDVISLHEINKTNRIKKYIPSQERHLTIIYK